MNELSPGVSAEAAPPPRAALAGDDTVLPFQVDALDVRGRVVRLGALVDGVLKSHAYPKPVATLLGEAIVLGVLIGSSLKFEGRFILQTKTDGPVDLLVVDFIAPDGVRAYARVDEERLAAAVAAGKASPGELLGHGYLAMTIDQGLSVNRYQGLVALEGGGLEDAAHTYFRNSEQIPTRVRLAVGEVVTSSGTSYRAGGLMVQFLPQDPKRARMPDWDPGDAPEGTPRVESMEDDAWVEAQAITATIADDELIDPGIEAERLLYRLFHERGVRVFQPTGVSAKCTCTREKIVNMLRQFSDDDRSHMVEDGRIKVTCEFCSTSYTIDPAEIGAE